MLWGFGTRRDTWIATSSTLPRRGFQMKKHYMRTAAMLLITGVLLAACGSGRSEGGQASSPTTAGGSVGSSAVPQFGDLASPCGPGSPSGTPDQAVDASTVTIGYGDDAGYQASPGLGHEASDALKAMISWCNDQGGINGRQVVGKYYDAKITDLTNVMTEACSQTFMLVGEFYALPETGEPTRLGCGLPAVPGVLSGAGITMAPLMVAPYPQPSDEYNIGTASELAKAFPEQVKKAAMMVAQFPVVIEGTQMFSRTVTEAGWEFLGCDQSYPITGVADYRPIIQKFKDCGAEVVYSTDTGNGLQNILDAANQIDYHPIWLNGPATYTANFQAWNTNGNGDNLYFGNSFVPLDYTAEGSANAAYLDIVKAAGGDTGYSGQVSTSAFLLWATAAKACENDLTRDCVMQQLKGTHSWTAGGLSTQQDPGANRVDTCTQVMKMDGTKFVPWQPEQPGDFVCDPSWSVKVDPPIDSAADLKIGADRVAHNNLP